MAEMTTLEGISGLEGNQVLFDGKTDPEGSGVRLFNTRVVFSGENNILCLGEGVTVRNSEIKFHGSGSIVYLSKSRNQYLLNIDIYNNSVCFIDKNCCMNGILHCILSEQKNIIIGRRCLLSFDSWLRVADPHLIYDAETGNRTNPSRSIYIGDHVWVGQSAIILKGVQIGSGSIIGAMSLVNKSVPSNCVAAGNPAKVVKENIFWDGENVHAFTDELTARRSHTDNRKFVFRGDQGREFISGVESSLSGMGSAQERLSFLKQTLVPRQPGRFAIRAAR